MKFGVSRLIVLASEGSPFQFAKLISRAARAPPGPPLATPIDRKVGCLCIDHDLRPANFPARVSKQLPLVNGKNRFSAVILRIINYFANRGTVGVWTTWYSHRVGRGGGGRGHRLDLESALFRRKRGKKVKVGKEEVCHARLTDAFNTLRYVRKLVEIGGGEG